MRLRTCPCLFSLAGSLAALVPAVSTAQHASATRGSATSAAERRPVSRTQDEQGVRGVIDHLISAWNRHDAAAAAAVMTADVDMVAPPGFLAQGRARIEADSPAMFNTLYKGSHESATSDRIRFLRPDVALVDGTFIIVGPNFPGDARGLQTVVLVKDQRHWAIAAFRRMIPIGPPPGPASPPPGGAASSRP